MGIRRLQISSQLILILMAIALQPKVVKDNKWKDHGLFQDAFRGYNVRVVPPYTRVNADGTTTDIKTHIKVTDPDNSDMLLNVGIDGRNLEAITKDKESLCRCVVMENVADAKYCVFLAGTTEADVLSFSL
jgi:hypothetical protein